MYESETNTLEFFATLILNIYAYNLSMLTPLVIGTSVGKFNKKTKKYPRSHFLKVVSLIGHTVFTLNNMTLYHH